MKLYSSSFISVILAFMVLIGYNNQSVEVVDNPNIPNFKSILKEDKTNVSTSIKIEIFENFTCKKCTEFTFNTLPKIKNLAKEADDIELRLYYIPDTTNELYYKSALSLKCASDQGKFWDMHFKMHKNKKELNKKSFFQFAKELELKAKAIDECIKEEVHKINIEKDLQYVLEKKITIWPSIIINEYRLIGNQPFENIERIIEQIRKNRRTSGSNVIKPGSI